MKGAIAWMARNSVAANLLMTLLVLVGGISAVTIVQEVFPESSLERIEVRVEYPGASPEEVEESVVRRIEEQIASLEGIRVLTGLAAENVGVVTAQLELGVDVSRKLDEIKAEVDRITTFPEEAEEPLVRELTNRQQVIQLAVHGDVGERTLKELARRIEDDLSNLDDVSFVTINGVRNYEISVEVSEEELRAYGVSLQQVAGAVRRGSLELPGGSVETRGEEILIRTRGRSYTGDDFREIIVLARPNGAVVRLGDLAQVRDGFEETDLITRFDGRPAAMVEVYRTSDEQVLQQVDAISAYLAELRASLPTGIAVDVWQDNARLLESRLNLLVKNGLMGLALVILALALFLNLRLAFWVSMGLFISFLASFAVISYVGVSVNLISLVAFILALGIVVDDAIVIGENIFKEQEQGVPPLQAAVRGATRLARPVIFAVLTTIAAFSPLLLVPGTFGKLFQAIPVVVISVLALSLVESLFVLPAHLSHVRARRRRKGRVTRAVEGVQERFSRFLDWNIDGPLTRTLEFATKHYGLVIVSAISVVLLCLGFVGGGLIRFTPVPEIEGENVIARLEMPEGTTAERTRAVTAYLEETGREAVAELQAELAEDHPPLLRHVFTSVGAQPSQQRGPAAGSQTQLTRPHVAEVNLELLSAEERQTPASRIAGVWREKAGSIPGVSSLTFQSELISLGKAIQAEVSAPTPEAVDLAVERFKAELAEFAGVVDIEDDMDPGKREIELTLRPQARSLGVTLDDLARQVRGAYYGYEALRVQRGREDLRVMVRLPEAQRDATADLLQFRVRTPDGAEIPLSEVAELSFGYGSSSINRRDRRRVVTVTADVDEEAVTAQEVITALGDGPLAALARDVPGVRVTFEGQQREVEDAVGALLRGFIVALFVIYALLAIPFRSYVQPFIVMAAIPFGIVGAVIGHLLLGLHVSILSIFGIVGLSGVVVNDSLVLIDFINEQREKGLSMREAVIEGGRVRFRPILLTSLTTFLGVLPLVLETSLQAQFLIPIAASLGFGVLFATFIILVLVPAMAMSVHDATEWIRSRREAAAGEAAGQVELAPEGAGG